MHQLRIVAKVLQKNGRNIYFAKKLHATIKKYPALPYKAEKDGKELTDNHHHHHPPKPALSPMIVVISNRYRLLFHSAAPYRTDIDSLFTQRRHIEPI